MKIFSINNSNFNQGFKGKYVSIRHGGDIKQFPEWHKNSYAETTLGAYHEDQKNRVYFASPMEPISDNIKENADKVIYDNEPSYPDVNKEVSRNYFGTERKNYKDDFEEIRKYYYRREMGGFASVEEAKYQQWQAAECARLYDKGGHLRYVKEQAEDEIVKLKDDNNNITRATEVAQKELESQNEMKLSLERQISNLKDMKAPYDNLIKTADKGSINETAMYTVAGVRAQKVKYSSQNQDSKFANKYEKYSSNMTANTYKEISEQDSKGYKISKAKENAQKESTKLENSIKDFESIKSGCIKTIDEITNYIQSLQVKLASNNKKLAEKKSLIEDCKAKLIPIFDELKNFYAKQGIKVIKKV